MPTSWRPGGFGGDEATTREVRHKTLCYTIGVLLLPVDMPFRDFEQLRIAFIESDHDRDGFVSRRGVFPLLKSRCSIDKAVTAALAIADVGKTDVLDLCSTAVADLIAREFFGAGPSGQPLLGPFDAGNLAKRMLDRFFQAFGDRRQPSVTVQAIRQRLRTPTATDVELHAGVRYADLLEALPEDRAIDSAVLSQQLSANAGRGTPLGMDDQVDGDAEGEGSWSGLDVISIFQGCGVGSWKRSVKIH